MSKRILIAVLLMCAAGVAYVLYHSLEYYEEERNLGWSALAQRNPYLAAQRYAEALGADVETFDSYARLQSLATFDTLFVPDSGLIISERRVEGVIDWVRDGGHLIVAAQAPGYSGVDSLLDYFDLTIETSGFTGSAEADVDDEPQETPGNDDASDEDDERKVSDYLKEYNEEIDRQPDEDEEESLSDREMAQQFEEMTRSELVTDLRFSGIDYQLRAYFKLRYTLSHPSFISDGETTDRYTLLYATGDEWGYHFLQFELGGGLVTVLSDPALFESHDITHFDHAYLWQILTSNAKSLGLLHGSRMPSLGALIWRFMPEALCAFMALLLAWLWYRLPRFGAAHKINYQTRRSVLEHIAASSAFLWRGNWQQALLVPLQAEIQVRAERTLPAFSAASAGERLSILADISGQPRSVVESAMQAQSGLNEDSFLLIVKTLQRIKESL